MLDDYLSHEECDSLIKYYKENEERLSVKHGMIYPLKFKEGYHKFPELVNRLNATAKLFGNNQINWMQIVKWPVGAFQLHHHDQSQPDITLSSILYLNDDYEGGQTNYEDGTIFKPKKGSGRGGAKKASLEQLKKIPKKTKPAKTISSESVKRLIGDMKERGVVKS